jgi:hypothetical protein
VTRVRASRQVGVETRMVSVERILEYANTLPQEAQVRTTPSWTRRWANSSLV